MGRILHLISQLEEGGAQRILSNVIPLSSRHQIEVASLIASPPQKLFPFFRDCPVPLHFLSDSQDFYDPGILPALRKLIRKQRYDLVQCWLFESIVQGVMAGRVEDLPCIAFPHSMTIVLKTHHKLWERPLIRNGLHSADLVVFPSHSTSIDFLQAGLADARSMRVIPNGVDCNQFRPAGGAGNAIVAVGRLSVEKGFDELQKVMRQLRTSHPETQCLVAGGGEPGDASFPDLQQLGYIDDIKEIYKQAALYISTSRVEGLSVALLEAQAMGIPAVVRRIGSNSEVIEEGINGFLVDSEAEYVEACRRLLADSSLRQEMGKSAREIACDRFSIERQATQMEAVQDELL